MTMTAPTIIGFSPGTTIKSADVDTNFTNTQTSIQGIINALTGAAAQQFTFLSTANNAIALTGQLPTAPAADQDVIGAMVAGDTAVRAGFYIRADGNGGLRVGIGTSISATLYSISGHWQTNSQFWLQQTIGGGNKLYLRIDSTDQKSFGLAYNAFSNALYFYDYTDSRYMAEFGNDGSMYVGTGTATPGNYFPQLASAGGGSPGKKIWVGTTNPGGAASEGDLWFNG